jgi:SAM-dependent methyltransferase
MKIHRGNFESNLTFLARVPYLQTPRRILEIGSGMGALVHELIKKGHHVTGTEVNPEYMDYAQKEYGIELVSINTETTKLPFADASFDVVVSFDVFEHIPDTKGHIAEVKRVLAPGGKYLVCTPNQWTNIPFEIIKEKSLTKYKEYHCALHNYWAIQKRFAEAGFTTDFIEVPLVTPFFLQKMKKYFGSFGIFLVKVLQPDSWPTWLKTNFYVVATKKN